MHSPEIRTGERGREVTDIDVLIQGYSNYCLHVLKLQPKTVKEYTKDVVRWAAWWKRPVEFFKPEEWDDWVMSLSQGGACGRSINRYRASLKKFFWYLRRRKIVSHDPSYDSLAAKVEKPLPVILTQEEIPLVRRRLQNHRTRAIFALLYDCGLRNQEARELTVDRVAPDRIHVTGKGAKDRIINFPPKVYETLKAWLEVRPAGTSWLFPTASGTPIKEDQVGKLVKRIVKGAKIDRHVTPHTLRHSIATHLVERGMLVENLQKWLGHESIETTMIYVKLAQQRVKEAVLKVHPLA